MGRIFVHWITVRALGMTIGRKQLWMIERRCLLYRARIGQAVAQEINQVLLLLQGQAQDLDIGIHVLHLRDCVEITAAVVELHDLFQGQLAAIVEIRSRQSHVAQLGRLEEAASGDVV